MKNRLVCRVGGVEDWRSCSEEEDSDEEWVDVNHSSDEEQVSL